MKKLNVLLLCCFCSLLSAQNYVSITIDDVPNTQKYFFDNFQPKLLEKLDELNIPITIFINEGWIYKNDHEVKNFALLKEWIKKLYTELGNHSFDHPRYSEIGEQAFAENVNKGAYISRELANKNNKQLRFFRFPFNDLGNGNQQQSFMAKYLHSQGYTVAPFTIESSDWMFDYIYEYYLKKGEKDKAKQIGEKYVDMTLAYFDFFDELTRKQYGRPIKHIYLCHDNSINADYLAVLVERLKAKDYEFISMGDAMQDEVYAQTNNYSKKWGVSWVYRWMQENKAMYQLMRSEPDISSVQKLYEELLEANNKGT